MVGSVLEGALIGAHHIAEKAQKALKEKMCKYEIEGFAQVICSQHTGEAISYLIQGSGLGALRHNAVLLGWPERWRDGESAKTFVGMLRLVATQQLAVVVPKGIALFPTENDRPNGPIDVWWLVHDGGMLILLGE